jgi:hypothetical protein
MEKTMDPLMRKLFQPREAREKLRGMGGIMSSSPQLASTVAKFQQGGPIQSRSLGMPSAPDAPLPSAGRARATRVGDRTFVLTDDGRVLDAQTGAPAPQEVAVEVMRKLNPQLSMMDIVGAEPEYGMGGVNPSFREDTSGQLPPMPSDLAPMSVPTMPADPEAPFDMAAFQRDLIGAGRAVAGPGLMAIDELPYDGPLTLGFDTAALSGAFGGSPDGQASLTDQYRQIMDELGTPGISENRRRALNTQLDTISLALKAARADDSIVSAGGRAGEFITDMAGNVVSAFDVDAGEGVFDFGDRLREYSATTPEEAASIVEQLALESAREAAAQRDAQGLTTSLRTTEDVVDAAQEAAQTVTSTSVAGVEPPSVAETTAETPTAPVAVAVAETAAETPPAPTLDLDLNDPTTYDTDFDEMMKRLGGATGKDDKSSRQKAMADLAMIGLAIAAGQSPDALTNIAQGALTGMKAIRAEGAAKDAVASETRALAAKLATDKEIARIRVPSGGGTYTPDRMIAQAVDSILAAPDFFDVFGADGKTVDLAKVAKKAKELVKNVFSTRVVVQDGVRFQELPDGTYKELGS